LKKWKRRNDFPNVLKPFFMKKASAKANANIALVKYWGKRDENLILPQNGSISMTVSALQAHTTVAFSESYRADSLVLNGKEMGPGDKNYDDYVGRFLAVVRKETGAKMAAKIASRNNFPTSAGLASSAAGFAALAAAVNEALGMGLNKRELSILARKGSGSAARSVFGGFVEWKKGKKKDGSDSYTRQITSPQRWPEFRMLVCLSSKKEKKVKSRAGMQQTVDTSPFYNCWLDSVEDDLRRVKRGILRKDLSSVGKTAEENCLKMHALMMSTRPALIYWNAVTLDIINSVWRWREEGLECYFTIDAGPQVKIICLKDRLAELEKRCRRIKGLAGLIAAEPGEGPEIVSQHLF
jgi:diphosphomevalonate decarboxylase